MRFFEQLFNFEAEETAGEVVFFKLFELFLVVFSALLAWQWGLYSLSYRNIEVPAGIAQHVDVSFMAGTGATIYNASVICILLAVGYLRRWRYAYLLGFVLLHLQYVTRFSFGKTPHGANALAMTLLGLALANAFFSDPSVRRRFTMGFAYFFLGLGYVSAAVSKLVGTGLSWPDGRHLWMWIVEKGIDAYAKTGTYGYNWLQEWVLRSHLLATSFLTLGLLTEALAFLIWWRRLRTPVLLALLAMHVGIYVVMNISFELSMYEVLLLALPWAAWIDRAIAHEKVGRLLVPIADASARMC